MSAFNSGYSYVGNFGEITGFFFFIVDCMHAFIQKLNIKIPIMIRNNVLEIPLMGLVLGAILISFVVSVFVKGAKG